MYTQQEYLYGWLFYLLGVAIVLLAGWMMTAPIKWKALKLTLRLSAVVIFLLPWYANDDMGYLAPAWIIAGFEGVFDGPDAFWRAGRPLLIALSGALLLAAIASLGVALKRRRAD